ncbi:MAG: hypothetical protein SFY70_11820, partial [Bacteroidia bacterium]|nr:hypothetical protein [Bacteroidia bacterium]
MVPRRLSIKKYEDPFLHSIDDFIINISSITNTFHALHSVIEKHVHASLEPLKKRFPEAFADKKVGDTVTLKAGDTAEHRFFVHNVILKADSLAASYYNFPMAYAIVLKSFLDNLFSDLIRIYLVETPTKLKAFNKEIKYSEVLDASSIEELKNKLIEEVVLGFTRKSHIEMIKFLEKEFDLTDLRESLPNFSDFDEFCQRRNLLTHNNSKPNEEYSKKYFENDNNPEYLVIERDYLFRQSYNILSIGVITSFLVWRKIRKSDSRAVSQNINEVGLSLLENNFYQSAVDLFEFALKNKAIYKDGEFEFIFKLNLAQSYKRIDRMDSAASVIESTNWDILAIQFRICKFSIESNKKEMFRLMREAGQNCTIKLHDYLYWPIF